ncbi:helix-turn-helix transcriptional regulator [Aeoliella mucimassa]|uniref:Helix-turn-helix domain protein n=1 Tax=Aeoliella mucimassa TaxID=2527972 RepID=A0A518AS19_9BACT|nr:helix-turn-helix domain-containing protein [Aeoliella mucimassa]QDU57514.1 Helix-turn-helix domain protein [Aeoliella mucimassa]
MAENREPAHEHNDDSLERATPDSLQDAPMMMTAEEIAHCLQVSVRTIWRLKAKGDLPKSVKVGRAVRWRRSDILTWIEQGCPATDSLINKLMYAVFTRPLYKLMGRL